jgi:hypothetical protein
MAAGLRTVGEVEILADEALRELGLILPIGASFALLDIVLAKAGRIFPKEIVEVSSDSSIGDLPWGYFGRHGLAVRYWLLRRQPDMTVGDLLSMSLEERLESVVADEDDADVVAFKQDDADIIMLVLYIGGHLG